MTNSLTRTHAHTGKEGVKGARFTATASLPSSLSCTCEWVGESAGRRQREPLLLDLLVTQGVWTMNQATLFLLSYSRVCKLRYPCIVTDADHPL